MSTLQGLAANALATMFLLLFQETPPRAGKAQSAQYGGIAR